MTTKVGHRASVRNSRRPAALFAFMLLFVAAASAQADPIRPAGGSPKSAPAARDLARSAAVPQQVLVRFRANATPSDRAETRRTQRAQLVDVLPIQGLQLLKLPAGADVGRAVTALERRRDVLYAQPNYTRQLQAMPNDPRLRELWGLHNTGQAVNGGPAGQPDADIDAPEAWDLTTGSSNVVVAVVDSGVAYDNPALAPNTWRNPGETGAGRESNGVDDNGNGYVDDWRGWDFGEGDNDPADDDGHGSHVAGTIGARGNDGAEIVGVNWNVSLMPLRVADTNGAIADASIAEAFVYAARNGAKVVNASLGGPGNAPAIEDAVRAHPETLYVIAAGNGGDDAKGDNNDVQPEYPCALPQANLICVAATDAQDRLTDFSNYGRTSVDLAAPGKSILSAGPAFRDVLSEGFEDASGNPAAPGWVTESFGATAAAWSLTDSIASTPGGWSLTDSAGLCFPGVSTDGCYRHNVEVVARSPQLDLRGLRGCSLSHVVLTETEGLDNGNLTDYVGIEAVGPGMSPTPLDVYFGEVSGSFNYSLKGFDGHAGVQIHYTFVSDAANPPDGFGGQLFYDGAYLDDVKVRCQSSQYQSNDNYYEDGTSMATPHVAGVAALLWARNPEATVGQVREAILGGVDHKPDLAGATAAGGRLNAAAALAKLPPRDRDGDSVPDERDACPDVPARAANGCPAPNGIACVSTNQRLRSILTRGLRLVARSDAGGQIKAGWAIDRRLAMRLRLRTTVAGAAASVRAGQRLSLAPRFNRGLVRPVSRRTARRARRKLLRRRRLAVTIAAWFNSEHGNQSVTVAKFVATRNGLKRVGMPTKPRHCFRSVPR